MHDTIELCTILVVEDDALVRMHGVDIFVDAGFEVMEAADADEAIAILSKHDHVHLLFSDVDMPGSMDGLELAHLVYARWPHIRLLMTSGHHHLGLSQLPTSGMFVRKPWAKANLVERVRELLAA
jgi:CheY-like chemotaxis protein